MKALNTAEQFEKAIAGGRPSIVKFSAGWCPDCTRMNMFIDPIVNEYKQYDWYEVDRDELPEYANQYEVMGIPSLLLFANGEKKAHLHSANAKSPEQVRSFLEGLAD